MTERAGQNRALPFAVAALGIALYTVMDAVMKGLALSFGAYNALFWRLVAGVIVTGALFLVARPKLPALAVVRVHAARSVVVAIMALAFFWGIARVPLAEAVALSFIAPLIALALAAFFLGERISTRSIGGSVLGLAGVGIILAGRLGGEFREDTALGMAAVLVSAVFYAVNLVMARHQAQLAKPVEIAFFQNMFVAFLYLLPAPWLATLPGTWQWPAIVGAAMLAVTSLLLMSWAYARAEAQQLVVVEYTAFIWSALAGWVVFAEPVTALTILGTVLIVAGCLLAARQRGAPSLPEAEAAA